MKNQTFQFHYQLYKDIYNIGETAHVGYGITVIDIATHSTYLTVEDISVSEHEIAELIERCNRLQLAPEQLHDVVQDWLACVEC